ncbi:MAG: D-alanyl-D-alanine endopeptidase [Candidatus Nomurabacteria bacterium GW2011_GWF2_43_8]|uniref:D-alanyl-D-alanine endopeptidase n=1 Tax=Candidatus Nomurabacteria bacterium GW2011_GWF2_43_8 TaxID=1618779 RepID=A0A0G1IF44_9BACT|nr:MAG: D-alanyl-D-alanine endopeptidase [Candidatus Nomurabacteria bacterium GW2011_GWF2_43_8]
MKPASNKTKTNLVLWAMFPVLLGVFLASFIFSALKTGNALNLEGNQESSLAQPANTATAKPRYFYVNKDTSGQPRVSAKAFLVGDLNTGEVILAQNQNKKFSLASVSKLMTALIASEMNGRDENTQVSKKAVERNIGCKGNSRQQQHHRNINFNHKPAIRMSF